MNMEPCMHDITKIIRGKYHTTNMLAQEQYLIDIRGRARNALGGAL